MANSIILNISADTLVIFGKDMDRLEQFYHDILGLEIIERTGSDWIVLNAGLVKIGLHKIGSQYLNNNEAFRAENNIKIVFNTEDIAATRNLLLANHINIKSIVQYPAYPYLVCDGEDPEGNVFQLKQAL